MGIYKVKVIVNIHNVTVLLTASDSKGNVEEIKLQPHTSKMGIVVT